MAEQDEEKEPLFPEGYEHFRDKAQFAASRLRSIEQRIKAIPVENPRDTSYRLRFDPPALGRALDRWRNREDRQLLEAQKDEIEKQAMKKMEKDILEWGIDPEKAGQIRTATIDTLHPNPYQGKSDQQLRADRSAQKDLNYSQNYMRAWIDRQHKKVLSLQKQEEKPAPEPRPLYRQSSPKVNFTPMSTGSTGSSGNPKSRPRQPGPGKD